MLSNAEMNKRLTPEKRIGLAIRQQREALGWSQEMLAFESGLHRTYIGAVERGEKNLTLRNAVRITHAMQSNIADLCLLLSCKVLSLYCFTLYFNSLGQTHAATFQSPYASVPSLTSVM